MKRYLLSLALAVAAALSCSSRSHLIRGADAVAVFGGSGVTQTNIRSNPDSVLAKYTVSFKIPNPLIDQGIAISRRFDPNHEGVIYCRAVLLDSLATEADIASACRKDSLDTAASEAFRKKYLAERVTPGQFRIRISMESGFSSKSLDQSHWVIYLLNAKGIAIEPQRIDSTPVTSRDDSVYSSFSRMSMARSLMRSDITLYFNRVTFFKEDLLGSGNPYIALDLVSDQKTVARVGWKRSEK